MAEMLTPKESYVYSKLIFRPLYDSFGVELGLGHHHFYKHTIPSGLVSQRCKKLFISSESIIKLL
jgi:hypothetical protein